MRRLKVLLKNTRITGVGFLLRAVLELSRASLRCLAPLVRPYRYLRKVVLRPLTTANQQRYLRAEWARIRSAPGYGMPDSLEALGLSRDEIGANAELADIDQDGFYVPLVDGLAHLPIKSRADALPRLRYRLKLIVHDGALAIRKDFGGNRHAFTREAFALLKLRDSGCNLPTVLDLDLDRNVLVMSFIPGRVLREELAKKGVRLRNCDRADPTVEDEQAKQDHIEQSKKILHEVVGPEFVADLYEQVRVLHSHRFLLGDIKYGNIIIGDDGRPHLVDLESAFRFREVPDSIFPLFASRNIDTFNDLFGTEHVSLKSLRRKIASMRKTRFKNWYSPAVLGLGYRIGNIFNIGSGYGRWQFLLKQELPEVKSKRVLDLGANNAFYGLQLLRQGAAEVVSVERDGTYFEQGLFLKEAFELLDNKPAYNLNYVQGEMSEVMRGDLGKFDFAIALCCLYYLDDAEIRALVSRMSKATDTFIVQCNENQAISRDEQETFEKATVRYSLEVLHENGFPNTRVIAPRGYDRPLIIASKN